MTTLQKPLANRHAAVGTREWAAALIAEFGAQLGAEYFGRQLSFDEATADFRERQPRVRGGFASRFARLMRDEPEPTSREEKPLTGFASKFRFPGEEREPPRPREERSSQSAAAAPAQQRLATAKRPQRDPSPDLSDDGEKVELKGFAAKLVFPDERST